MQAAAADNYQGSYPTIPPQALLGQMVYC
jgi:hypothetical protein